MPEKKQVFVVYVVSKALSWLSASGMLQAFQEIIFGVLSTVSRPFGLVLHKTTILCDQE